MSSFDEALRREQAIQQAADADHRSADARRASGAQRAASAVQRALLDFVRHLAQAGVSPKTVELYSNFKPGLIRGKNQPVYSPAGYVLSTISRGGHGTGVPAYLEHLSLVTAEAQLFSFWRARYGSDHRLEYVPITAESLAAGQVNLTSTIHLDSDGNPYISIHGPGDSLERISVETALARHAAQMLRQ